MRNVLLRLDKCKMLCQVLDCVLFTVKFFIDQSVAITVDASENSGISHISSLPELRGKFLFYFVTFHDAAIILLAFVNLISGLGLGEGA